MGDIVGAQTKQAFTHWTALRDIMFRVGLRGFGDPAVRNFMVAFGDEALVGMQWACTAHSGTL